jgi:hypothetical protein
VVEPEVIIVPVVFSMPAIVLLARMWFRHKEKMATLDPAPGLVRSLEARLERVEQAVDAIAVEVERVGEGQRFVTKLLADRLPPPREESPPALPERVITPR